MKHAFNRRTFLRASGSALGAATLGNVLAPLASAQPTAAPADITRIDLGYAWVLQGAGCNVLTLPGMRENGALLVDGGLAEHSDALLQAVFDVTGQERVHTLINTHWHPEQTGSNERLGMEGAQIFAHERSQLCLKNSVLSSTFEGRYGPLADAGIPTQVTRGDGSMKFAGQEILYGWLPAAHTDGDIFLYFPILDTLVAGGPVTTGQWPILDIRQGGWMGGLMTAYEKLSAVVSADTVVIPAHGPITNGTEILRMRSMYTDIHLWLAEQLNLGMGPDDVVLNHPFQAFEEKFGDATAFLDAAHRSLQLAYLPD